LNGRKSNFSIGVNDRDQMKKEAIEREEFFYQDPTLKIQNEKLSPSMDEARQDSPETIEGDGEAPKEKQIKNSCLRRLRRCKKRKETKGIHVEFIDLLSKGVIPVEAQKRPNESNWRRLQRIWQGRKETERIHDELTDLLPEGVMPFEELKRDYERKRQLKQINHLDCIPEAHQGLLLKIEEC